MLTTYRLEIAYTLIGMAIAAVAIMLPIYLSRRRQDRRRRAGVKDYNR